MIVIQGSEELGGGNTPTTFNLEIDNDNVDVIKDDKIVKSDEYVEPDQKMAKYESSDEAGSVNVVIQATIDNVTNFTLTEATAVGKVYTINPPSKDVEGLSKEEYLREMSSFVGANVDVEAGTASWNSPINDHISCLAESTEEEKDCLEIFIAAQDGNNITFSYNGVDFKRLFAKDGADYFICSEIKAKGTGTIVDTGAVGTVEFTYSHASGYPIANGVFGLSSDIINFITFDDNIHMASGWLDGMDISYQQRTLVKAENSMYAPMFTYLFYSAISPRYFVPNVEKMAFCGQITDGLYRLPWVVTNNASFGTAPAEVSVTARGPGLTGDPTVTSTIDTVSFNTENVSTSSSRVLLDLVIENTVFGVSTFEVPCGIGRGEFVSSAVDCKIAMDTVSNTGNFGRTYEATTADLYSFHNLINGLENYLGYFDFNIFLMQLPFVYLTRGLSCIAFSNTIELVFFLVYEQEKMTLGSTEMNSMMSGISSVIERHNANLGGAATNVPKSLRKDMSKQYLETVSQRVFRQKRALSGEYVFTWYVFCVPITFYFHRSAPWMPTAPDVGVPLEVNILENAEADNGAMTDDHVAMIKKYMATNIFETRVDWILEPIFIKKNATTWFQMGETVVLKKDGRHQELYAVNDNGYKIGDFSNKNNTPEYVSIPGDIGKQWNKWKEEVLSAQNLFSHLHPDTPTIVGTDAEKFVENFNVGYSLANIFNEYAVIDITNEIIIRKGETTEVKLLRPNKDVIIALKK